MAQAVRYPDLIAKKRDGGELTEKEIQDFVRGVVTADMADVQIGAMLMAIFHNGLSTQELVNLTREMVVSGETLTWPKEWSGLLMDKHSTGGVGDKVSLVLMPALASFGFKLPTISGRGLGHTGGTLDKLEAVPGFRVQLTSEEMLQILEKVGVFIAGQTKSICPADKTLYEFRDVTATVDHIGLIASSIVSKKIAENIGSLVLDVKYGRGAFMQAEEKARALAQAMVSCSKGLGVNCISCLTDMNSPIGFMVGNALEVAESIETLQGKGPEDLVQLVAQLGGNLLEVSGHVANAEEGMQKIRQALKDGSALDKFKRMLEGQGVKAEIARDICDSSIDKWTIMTPAKYKTEFKAPSDGYIRVIDAMLIAQSVHMLGGGRNAPGEPVKLAVGLQLLVDIGDKVNAGDPWVIVHHDDPIPETVTSKLTQALEVSTDPVPPRETRLKEVIRA